MTLAARRLVWPLIATVVVIGALFLTMFPLRTWIDQRDSISASRSELAELDEELAALDDRIAALDSPEEVELIAREKYGLVFPGEEAYSLLPLPVPPIDIPPGWPFTGAPPADSP